MGVFIIAGISYKNGDPRRMVFGIDSFGNVCDSSSNTAHSSNPNSGIDTSGRRYLFYHDPLDTSALVLCVESCPTVSPADDDVDSLLCEEAHSAAQIAETEATEEAPMPFFAPNVTEGTEPWS